MPDFEMSVLKSALLHRASAAGYFIPLMVSSMVFSDNFSVSEFNIFLG